MALQTTHTLIFIVMALQTINTHAQSYLKVWDLQKCFVRFLFRKVALNWSKVKVKTFIMLPKIYISNYCSFSTLHSSENPKKKGKWLLKIQLCHHRD